MHLIFFPNEYNKFNKTNARFYLSYDTKITLYLQILHLKVTISPLEHAMFLWTPTRYVTPLFAYLTR